MDDARAYELMKGSAAEQNLCCKILQWSTSKSSVVDLHHLVLGHGVSDAGH